VCGQCSFKSSYKVCPMRYPRVCCTAYQCCIPEAPAPRPRHHSWLVSLGSVIPSFLVKELLHDASRTKYVAWSVRKDHSCFVSHHTNVLCKIVMQQFFAPTSTKTFPHRFTVIIEQYHADSSTMSLLTYCIFLVPTHYDISSTLAFTIHVQTNSRRL
jgi:hypothetical protein